MFLERLWWAAGLKCATWAASLFLLIALKWSVQITFGWSRFFFVFPAGFVTFTRLRESSSLKDNRAFGLFERWKDCDTVYFGLLQATIIFTFTTVEIILPYTSILLRSCFYSALSFQTSLRCSALRFPSLTCSGHSLQPGNWNIWRKTQNSHKKIIHSITSLLSLY